MCLDVECDYDLLRDGWHTARKEHRCEECARTIEPGERYRFWVIKSWDFGLDEQKMCAHCWGTIDLGAALTGCPKSWWWSMVHKLDPDDGGFVGDILVNHDLPPADRYRMLRTVVGRRRCWRRRDGSLLPVPGASTTRGDVREDQSVTGGSLTPGGESE